MQPAVQRNPAPPQLVAARSDALRMRWMPAIAGGVAGFVVNVAML
jgi:hypothetical protein